MSPGPLASRSFFWESSVDLRLYHSINGLAGRASWLDQLLKLGANFLPIAMGIVLIAVWFWPGEPIERSNRQRLVIYALCAALLGLALAQVIGHLWSRERPYVSHPSNLLLSPSGDPSFPSDHAIGGFALAAPFLFARRRVGLILLGMASLLAFCRVAAGTHYPTDVIAGAIIGTAAAIPVWNARTLIDLPLTPCIQLARRFRLA